MSAEYPDTVRLAIAERQLETLKEFLKSLGVHEDLIRAILSEDVRDVLLEKGAS